jgi:RNA polymerase sigma-70 factor (ECF subfamily)
MTTNLTVPVCRTRTHAQVTSFTDEQLLLRYRDTGDSEAFTTLVQRYERELFNYLRRYLGDADQADDVFQATFLQVHRRCHLFDAKRRLRPWLYSIANHQAIDSMRRSRRHQIMSLDVPSMHGPKTSTLAAALEAASPSPSAQLEDGEEQAWARNAVAKLPESQRAALTLIYFKGMKYRDAAAMLGVPEGTLKTRVHTAVASLRRCVTCPVGEPWKLRASA